MKRPLWLCVFLVLSCNNLPIGDGEMDQRGDFEGQTIGLHLFNSFTESKKIALGRSSNLVIGKNDDYESRILLTFVFSDTSFSGLDEIKLSMALNSSFENDTMPVDIYLLTGSFDEEEATWEKRTNAEAWDSAGGDFELSPLRSAVIKGDSMAVYFNYVELNRIKNAKGLILVPRDTGFVYLYSREGGHAAVLKLTKNGIVTVISVSTDCHILDGPVPFYVENWMGAGIASRNFLMFDYDSTIAEKRAIYGELSFRIEKVFARRDSIEIGVKELKERVSGYDTEVGPLIALKRISADDTSCTIDIVRYVQKMIDHPDSNFGVFLYITPENYDISTIKTVGGSFKLVVGYIAPPEPRP